MSSPAAAAIDVAVAIAVGAGGAGDAIDVAADAAVDAGPVRAWSSRAWTRRASPTVARHDTTIHVVSIATAISHMSCIAITPSTPRASQRTAPIATTCAPAVNRTASSLHHRGRSSTPSRAATSTHRRPACPRRRRGDIGVDDRRPSAIRAVVPPRLFVPGWGGSGPDHWQTRWQARFRGARRVEMPDWFAPERGPWIAALDGAIAAVSADHDRPPLLIAHSLGCIAVAAWASQHQRAIAGALLVAPADPERADAADVVRGFGPAPLARLPFPSLVVVADDDPYVTVERATSFAAAWGSALELVPGAGHINTASGHGDWPEGLTLLRQLAVDRAA